MSRLYALMADAPEVAAHFNADARDLTDVRRLISEGLRGIVVTEKDGRRVLRELTWGFPRHTREMAEHGEPPQRVGMVADLTNPMWDAMVVDPHYRCLIPLTHFANPEGESGKKTTTWFALKGHHIVAWAGFCRNTEEFGSVYAGMTMDANEAVMPTNDRMPVLLMPDEYEAWLHGSIRDVIRFQFRKPPPADRLEVLPTNDLWRNGKFPPVAQLPLL